MQLDGEGQGAMRSPEAVLGEQGRARFAHSARFAPANVEGWVWLIGEPKPPRLWRGAPRVLGGPL